MFGLLDFWDSLDAQQRWLSGSDVFPRLNTWFEPGLDVDTDGV